MRELFQNLELLEQSMPLRSRENRLTRFAGDRGGLLKSVHVAALAAGGRRSRQEQCRPNRAATLSTPHVRYNPAERSAHRARVSLGFPQLPLGRLWQIKAAAACSFWRQPGS